MENSLKLSFVLMLMALFFKFFGLKLLKKLEGFRGFYTDSPFLEGDSPYLYKGDGEDEKDRVKSGSEEDDLEGTIWGQTVCLGCGGIPSGRFVGYKECHCPTISYAICHKCGKGPCECSSLE